MRGVSRDLVLAWRRLASAPAFTLFSVVTLALGIGATTAIYSVVHAVLLKGPAYPDADRVAKLYHRDPRRGGSGPMLNLSAPDYEDYRLAQTSFSGVAAWTRFRHPLVDASGAELLTGEMVGGEYFAVVGVQAALGRTIQPSDDRPDAPKVMVLSDGLWRRRFGADPGVIGRTLSLGGDRFEVIGVMPRSFGGVDMPNLMPTPAWIPLSSSTPVNRWDPNDREQRWLHVIGRLERERTMEQAFAEFRSIGQRLDVEHPIGRGTSEYRARHEQQRSWFLMPASNVRMHESVDPLARPLATTIMVAVALVLLVACTNIANLMLARGSSRRHENAVRLALGASRWRLVREHLAEAVLVTGAGGLMALLIARVVVVKLLSADIAVVPGISIQVVPVLNVAVAGVAAASTFVSLLVFGLVPALHNTGANVRDALASDGQAPPLQRWRGRRNLIAAQVAVSGGLVAVAILCAQQLIESTRHDTGVDLDRLAFVRVDFSLEKKGEAYGRNVLEQVLQAARLQPGVEGVALSSGLPISNSPGAAVAVTAEKVREGMLLGGPAQLLSSTPDVFRVLGTRIVAGRGFDDRDAPGSERVAIINRSLAASLFGEGNPIGRSMVYQLRRFVGEDIPAIHTVTVAGVVEDTDVGSIGQRRGGVVFVPFPQHYVPAMSVVARASSDPSGLLDQLRRIVTRVDPGLAVLEATTGPEMAGAETLVARVGGAAAGLLGGLALLLAMAGLYGVMSDLISRRTREIGVRMALGAEPGRVIRMVLRDGARPVLEGLFLAIALGVIARMAFRPLFLRMVPAFDPIVLALVPVAFLGAAFVAAYFPARRAARVDPNAALRHL